MFTFEQVGGRCKLVQEDAARSIHRVPAWKDHARLRAWKAECHELRERRLEQQQVADFLQKHGFRDVNGSKVTWFGLRRTYPLRTAAKECDWEMVRLLQQVGAKVSR